jgi:hypothetical protein
MITAGPIPATQCQHTVLHPGKAFCLYLAALYVDQKPRGQTQMQSLVEGWAAWRIEFRANLPGPVSSIPKPGIHGIPGASS